MQACSCRVVAFVDSHMWSALSLSLGLSRSVSDRSLRVELVQCAQPSRLRAMVHEERCTGLIVGLMTDVLGERPDHAADIIAGAVGSGRHERTIVYIRPQPAEIRFACEISRRLHASVLIAGADTPWDAIVASAGLNEAEVGRSGRDATALSPEVSSALSLCARDPGKWTVKRLAAVAGISISTLERQFDTAGLPTPGQVLKAQRERVALGLALSERRS